MGNMASSLPNPTGLKPCTEGIPAAVEAQASHLPTSPHRSSAELASSNAAARHERTEVSMSTVKQLDGVPRKTHPLHLLDLPLDILKDIVKEVSQMND